MINECDDLFRAPGDIWMKDVLERVREQRPDVSYNHVLAWLYDLELRTCSVHTAGALGPDDQEIVHGDLLTLLTPAVDARDRDGRTPLHYAVDGLSNLDIDSSGYARPGGVQMVRTLIERGADGETADNDGVTPLAMLRKGIDEHVKRFGDTTWCTTALEALRLVEDQVLRKAAAQGGAVTDLPLVRAPARRRL